MDDVENDAIGYLRTEYDCPECGYNDSGEGDMTGETVTCAAEGCGCKFTITKVL